MTYDWDIIGHHPQLGQLEREMEQGNIGHAYLFFGPRQTGKFRIARTLAAILQCSNRFCRACKTCKSVLAGTHPDTLFFRDNGESLKIDTVRDLIHRAHLTTQSRFRIFAIENIERMPLEAQNSFLKILEEPPGKTLFLLTSSRINDVLPTVQSRVRSYCFYNVDSETLTEALKKEFTQLPDLDDIINMAQGRPGLAITLVKNEGALARQRELYGKIEIFLRKNDLAEKFMFVEALTDDEEDRGELNSFFDAFTRYLRKLLFEYFERYDASRKTRLELRKLVELFESLEKTRYLIQRNANKKLALENFLIQTEF